MQAKLKRYKILKYVMAKSVIDAVKKEKKIAVDDCWIDEEWKKEREFEGHKIEGFKNNNNKKIK